MARFLTAPVLCVAAAATLSCAIPAVAQISDTVPSVTVKYSDLNIGSRAGVQALFKRIDAAANTACGGAPDIRQLNQLASFEACCRSAVARAVVEVNSPMLKAMAHGGSPGGFAAR
ncbi:MAG TPA: UrcA family protein [Caulobacteraceae bacterium]|nr:UrcA family protein [Caulobacteraceae bacterium]